MFAILNNFKQISRQLSSVNLVFAAFYVTENKSANICVTIQEMIRYAVNSTIILEKRAKNDIILFRNYI